MLEDLLEKKEEVYVKMFGKKMRFVTSFLVLVMLIAQSAVFAQGGDKVAVELTGVGLKTELKLTLEDLKAMPAEAQIEDEYIYNSKTGEKSAKVKGVSLAYLLKKKQV